MTLLRRSRPLLVALLFLLVGSALLLLAVDARAWRKTITRDDLRFRALHSHVGLWQSPATLPGDPARALLGLSEPLAYRHALQLFWYGRVGSDPQSRRDVLTIRIDAQRRLEQIMRTARTPRERSTAANLLGVMTVTTPSADTETRVQTLRRAADYFQRAIAADATNFQAKLNLELVLRLQRPGQSRFGKDARGGYGFGRGRGIEIIGSGY